MATTFYPTATASSATSSSWTNSPTVRLLSLSRGAGVQTKTDNTVASLGTSFGTGQVNAAWGAAAGSTISATTDWPTGTLLFVTNPLDAIFVDLAATVNARALESSTMANYIVGAQVYRLPSGGGATSLAATGFGSGVELGTTEAAASFGLNMNTTLSAGDRLVLVLVYAGIGTSASGFTASGFYAGTSGGASGDTFITFGETITEQSAAAASLVIPHRHRSLIVR